SRPITLCTRFSSFVNPSRWTASWLYAFATSPMRPLFCAGSRTPISPSLAERRASSSRWRSCFLISTVPFSGARSGARLVRVFVSRAATADSFVRGIGPPVALPPSPGLEHRVDAPEAGRVRDQAERGLDAARLLGARHVEREQA